MYEWVIADFSYMSIFSQVAHQLVLFVAHSTTVQGCFSLLIDTQKACFITINASVPTPEMAALCLQSAYNDL